MSYKAQETDFWELNLEDPISLDSILGLGKYHHFVL